jgi:hypothetical protein
MCRFPFQKLKGTDGLWIWLHMQTIWIFEEIQNENELKIKFLSGFKGQIVYYVFKGGFVC